MTPRLEARSLGVVRGGRAILVDVDVAIAPGTFTALVGPNGSGKSTLLRALAGLQPLAGGEVRLEGRLLHQHERREVARHLAFLPQDTRCDFAFTVSEMVAMGRHPHRGRFTPESDDDRRAIRRAIDLCDLNHLVDRTVDRLSGGERQRVAIARCLAAEPDVVLLDEPTAHLDLDHSLAVLSLCASLARSGHGVIVATHDLAAACRYATDVIVLKAGRAVAAGAPEITLTRDLCRDVFLVDPEIVTTVRGDRAFIFTAARRDGAQPPHNPITQ